MQFALSQFYMRDVMYSSDRQTDTSKASNKYQIMTHRFSKISSPTPAASITILHVPDRPVRSAKWMSVRPPILEISAPFSDTLHSHYTSFHCRWISMMGASIDSKNQITLINFCEGPSFHSHFRCTSIYPMNMTHLTPVPSVVCGPNYSFFLKQKNEIVDQRNRYSLGSSTY
jgi:hypothetical protein